MKDISKDAIINFQFLPLENNNANADNTSVITAAAQVSTDGHYLQNQSITFHIDSGLAVFTDTGTDTSPGISGADGKAIKYFKSPFVGAGKISAYLTDNPTIGGVQSFEFKAWEPPNNTILDLKLVNNEALSDGTDKITVIATVTNTNKGLSGIKVNFILPDEGKAIFVDNGDDKTFGYTSEEGVVIKYITDMAPEHGLVEAFITKFGGDEIEDSKPFTFTAPSPNRLVLTLDKTIAVAGVDNIAATATVTYNQILLTGQLVHFSLPDSSAVFIDSNLQDSDGHSITSGTTDGNGVITKKFTDNRWEEGRVVAYADLGEINGINTEIDDSKEFIFTEPLSLAIEMKDLQITDEEPGNWSIDDEAPADGVWRFRATVTVTVAGVDGKRKGLKNVAVEFNLPPAPGGHAEFINSSKPYYALEYTDEDGVAYKEFSSKYIEDEGMPVQNRTITVDIPAHAGQNLSVSKPFIFSDPWEDVTDLKASFSAGQEQNIIYGNDWHQAELLLTIPLISSSGTVLNENNQPLIADVISCVKLIDFNSREELGVGALSAWHYTTKKNIYPGTNNDLQPDDTTNKIINGIAYITFYLTSSTTGNIQIGAKITPTGSKKEIYDALGGKFTISVLLTAVPPINYTLDRLDISGSQKAHIGQPPDDDVLSNTNGPEYEGNFWREWQYTIKIKSNEDNRRIFRCQLAPGATLPSDYAFSSKSNIIYNYKAYFWPNNIYDAANNPLPSQLSYPVKSSGTPGQNISLPTNTLKDTLYFTLYCAFGDLNFHEINAYPINIIIYDQFGNSGNFVVDPNAVPITYSPDDLPYLNFLRDGFESISLANTQRENSDLYFSPTNYDSKYVGKNSNSFIHGFANGDPLDANVPGIKFKVLSASTDPDNPQRIFTISCGDNQQQSYLKTDAVNRPIVITDINSASTWYLKPIWKNNTIVIANVAMGGIMSWNIVLVRDSKNVIYLLVYTNPYVLKEKIFEWVMVPGQ